jgi:hypothetical protein
MRDRLRAAAPLCLLVAGVALLWQTCRTKAEPAAVAEPATKTPSNPLPVSQIVLFSSGVGYFQREGQIDGKSQVDLAFPAGNVNDLLKSLVLQDLGGGKIRTITYDSQETIEKTLRSFTFDLSYNPTLGQILNQARGQKVEVTTAAGQPAVIAGDVVGMEVVPANVHDGEKDVLNLLCADGLRGIPLPNIQRVRFLDPALDTEFRRALAILAGAHDAQKKNVRLDFAGDGKRRVRVGYVVENPIWKTSYRLVLDKEGKPLLQGWAMVENTSDEDWNDVRLALVSGRPLSFQMNLYAPLYVPRPVVEPELFAWLRPPAYNGAIAFGGQQGFAGGGAGFAGLGAFGNLGGQFGQTGNLGAGGGAFGQFGNRYQGYGNLGGPFGAMSRGVNILGQRQPDDPNADAANADARLSYEELKKRRQEKQKAKEEAKEVGSALTALDLQESLDAATSATSVGDHFQYVVDQKVCLPRQKSALLPIVNQPAEASRVSVFNLSVHNKHPLLGLRFKNTTGHQLPQGPITVYDGGSYAGDSRVLDLQPNEERLLAYALDVGTEVKATQHSRPDPKVVSVKLARGVLHVRYTMRQHVTYTIQNRSEHDRLVVVEHPSAVDWKLVTPEKPAERSRDLYRFQVAVAAGKAGTLEVVSERGWAEDVSLTTPTDGAPHFALTALGAEIETYTDTRPTEIQSLRLSKGVAHATYRNRETRTYVVKNLTSQERTVTVDHLAQPGWKLVSPPVGKDGTDRTARRSLAIAPFKSAVQEFVEERIQPGDTPVTTMPDQTLRTLVESGVGSPRVKEALRKVAELRTRSAATHQALIELQGQLKEITDDQARLRANLERVPQTSAAYKRYLDKFDTQENDIEKLQARIKEQQQNERLQNKEYEAFVAGLEAE